MSNRRSKHEVLRMMHRVGLGDQTAEAEAVLPEVIDFEREDHLRLLEKVGVVPDVDELRDRMGGSP